MSASWARRPAVDSPLSSEGLGGELRPPETERHMRCSVSKVLISGQQSQLMPPTQLNQKSINGADLDTCPSACVSNLGRCNVVLSIRLNQWQRPELFDDGGCGLGSAEALQEFL